MERANRRKGVFYYNDPKDGKRHQIKEDDLMFAWYNNVCSQTTQIYTHVANRDIKRLANLL